MDTLVWARLFLLDERNELAQAAQRAWGQLVHVDSGSRDRAAVLYLLGWAEIRLRESLPRAAQALTGAAREADAVGDGLVRQGARGQLAVAFAWAGELTRARALLADLAEPGSAGDWQSYLGTPVDVGAGIVAFWADEQAELQARLRRGLELSAPHTSLAGVARFMLAVGTATGNDPSSRRYAAMEVQAMPREPGQGWNWPTLRDAAIAALEEGAGRRERALAIVRHTRSDDTPIVAFVFAGILRRAGEPGEALTVLRRLRGYEHLVPIRIATLASAALVQRRAGSVSAMHEMCSQAVELAAKEGIRRPFSEPEPELRIVLGEHIAWGTPYEDFLAECLQHASGRMDHALSERERQVLEQLRTTRTGAEIAARLGISLNTLKSHVRAIYRKLGVDSRRDAVRLASGDGKTNRTAL